MIALESIHRYRMKDLLILVFLSLLWASIATSYAHLAGPQSSYIVSLLIATFLMAFTVHLIRKAGAATLFYILGGLFTYALSDLGAVGTTKLITLLVMGIFFELVFITLKLELKSLQLDIIIGTALSAATLPFTTAFLLSPSLTLSLLGNIINLSLLSFFIGIVGAIISFIVWYELRTTKWILKFEYNP